ncbi:MAG: FTR1 family protein, partial [Sphingomonadales bacterium]
WMAEHARELIGRMNAVGASVAKGDLPMRALAFVVCLAVLREGSEVVLFLYGMAASSQGMTPLLLGGGLGLLGGTIIGAGLYFGLLRIPTRYLFKVTGWLILLLAAGMASEAARFLVQADALPALSSGPIWDTSWLLSEQSLVGQTLHTLIGYTPRPLGIQLTAYFVTIIIIGGFMFRISSTAAKAATTAVVVASALIGLDAFTATPASAAERVYSPIVEKGELELEIQGERKKGGEQSHKWEIGYGVTNRWATAIFLETEKEPGEGLETEAVAWENIIQLTEQGQYWLDVGAYVEYEGHLHDGGHDELETKLLLQKETGNFVHLANIIFEKEISGQDRDGWELGYAWQSKYRYRRELEFGVEGFGEFGELSDFEPSREQEHTVGPVLTGVFPIAKKWNLKYEAGIQFGLTEESPDNTVRGLIEIETYF